MENDIELVLKSSWRDTLTSFYIDAWKHFKDLDPEVVTVANVSEWTEGWLEHNMKFTKWEPEDQE